MSKIKERPILYNSEMVQQLITGNKTQTRRVMKFQPCEVENSTLSSGEKVQIFRCYKHPPKFKGCASGWCLSCPGPFTNPYGKIGDRLWVRETFEVHETESETLVQYRSDSSLLEVVEDLNPDGLDTEDIITLDKLKDKDHWMPSIFMNRFLSRILLEITNVRVERVQDISETDAKAEGVSGPSSNIYLFKELWDSINGKKENYSWKENPYVWVIEFKIIEIKGDHNHE